MLQQKDIDWLNGYKNKTPSKRVMYQNVHCSSIYNSQDMEATKVSIMR